MSNRRFGPSAVCVTAILSAVGLILPTLFAADPADGPPAAPPAPALAKPPAAVIELSGVPTELSLPAPAKVNLIVTATVRGVAPTRVWLARSADAPFSVPVSGVGDGRYQFNLADDRLALALRRGGGDGQCFVFAKGADGRVVESAPIRFALPGPEAHFSAHVGDGHGDAAKSLWVELGQAREFSVWVEPSLPGLTVKATIGGRSWPLEVDGDTNYSLVVTPEVAAAWAKAGRVDLAVDPPVHYPHGQSFFAIPSKLAVPADGLVVRCQEGDAAAVPGSNDFLSFAATQEGDTVLVRLRRSDGTDELGTGRLAAVPLIPTIPIPSHDPRRDPRAANPPAPESPTTFPPVGAGRPFRLSGAQYAWVVRSVVGGPRSPTTVTVVILEGKAAERAILQGVFHDLRRASVPEWYVMSFRGKRHAPAETVDFLDALSKQSAADSAAALVAAIKARERESKSEARISLPGGEEQPLAEWLMDQIRAAGWEPLRPDASQPAGATTGPATRPVGR